MKMSGQVHASTALSQGKGSQYLLSRRLSGHHNHSGRFGVEKLDHNSSVVLLVTYLIYQAAFLLHGRVNYSVV
jgi:hypothetical protein